MKKDIQTKEDIARLVDVFYDLVLKDEKLAHFFAHLDFETHKPKMVHFWSFVLLDEPGYTTNVFDKHLNLNANSADFNEWVKLFHSTVNELFEGKNAEAAKFRATTLGYTFGSKLDALNNQS
jgi:hemoglobin